MLRLWALFLVVALLGKLTLVGQRMLTVCQGVSANVVLDPSSQVIGNYCGGCNCRIGAFYTCIGVRLQT